MTNDSMRRLAPGVVAFATLALGVGAAFAQQTTTPDTQTSQGAQTSQTGSTSIELNKLEPQAKGCRVYFRVSNADHAYKVFKLDLVLFRPDAVIERRFAVDLGPLKADKKTVHLFDIDGTPCDQIGSFLINDVIECKADSGPVDDCLKAISVSSRSDVKLEK